MRKRRTGLPQTIRGLPCAKRPLRIRWDSRHTQIHWGCLSLQFNTSLRPPVAFFLGRVGEGWQERHGRLATWDIIFSEIPHPIAYVTERLNYNSYVTFVRSCNFRSNTSYITAQHLIIHIYFGFSTRSFLEPSIARLLHLLLGLKLLKMPSFRRIRTLLLLAAVLTFAVYYLTVCVYPT